MQVMQLLMYVIDCFYVFVPLKSKLYYACCIVTCSKHNVEEFNLLTFRWWLIEYC